MTMCLRSWMYANILKVPANQATTAEIGSTHKDKTIDEMKMSSISWRLNKTIATSKSLTMISCRCSCKALGFVDELLDGACELIRIEITSKFALVLEQIFY